MQASKVCRTDVTALMFQHDRQPSMAWDQSKRCVSAARAYTRLPVPGVVSASTGRAACWKSASNARRVQTSNVEVARQAAVRLGPVEVYAACLALHITPAQMRGEGRQQRGPECAFVMTLPNIPLLKYHTQLSFIAPPTAKAGLET